MTPIIDNALLQTLVSNTGQLVDEMRAFRAQSTIERREWQVERTEMHKHFGRAIPVSMAILVNCFSWLVILILLLRGQAAEIDAGLSHFHTKFGPSSERAE